MPSNEEVMTKVGMTVTVNVVSEFVACADCSSKSGSPTLCASCTQNSSTIFGLWRRVHTLEHEAHEMSLRLIAAREQKPVFPEASDLSPLP